MLTGIDQASIDAYAQRYVGYKNIYREETHRVSEGAAKKEEKPRKFQAIREQRATSCLPRRRLWNRVEQAAHEVFATFGFGEIRPPIFEATELFARSVGAKPTSFQRRCTLLSTDPKN